MKKPKKQFKCFTRIFLWMYVFSVYVLLTIDVYDDDEKFPI